MTNLPVKWPNWPQSSTAIENAVIQVLRSSRWAISGMSTGTESEERRFGRQFADYIGVRFGVPTSNGSSALVAALTAAGVGYGDEVLVPGLVWVACASAVARIGAIPVFVDLDETNYAMCPDSASTKIGPKTRAILLAHLSSSIADLDAFTTMADNHGIPLIEDCSQAHGAMWRGQRVGSFGSLAAFSFQSSKLLTAGEGGIVTTDDPTLAEHVHELRADGRRWTAASSTQGFPDLEPGSGRQGHNHCMTEMQAAILSNSLPLLDHQNEIRIERVRYLESRLETVEGVQILRRRNDPHVDIPTFWHLPVQVDVEAFGGANVESIRATVSEKIGLFLEPVGAPLNHNPLYQPGHYRRFPAKHRDALDLSGYELPVAERLSATCFTIPHHALLADTEALDVLVDGIECVQRHFRGAS